LIENDLITEIRQDIIYKPGYT